MPSAPSAPEDKRGLRTGTETEPGVGVVVARPSTRLEPGALTRLGATTASPRRNLHGTPATSGLARPGRRRCAQVSSGLWRHVVPGSWRAGRVVRQIHGTGRRATLGYCDGHPERAHSVSAHNIQVSTM